MSVVGTDESPQPVAVEIMPSIPLAPLFTFTEKGNFTSFCEGLFSVSFATGYKKNSPSLTGMLFDKNSDIGDDFCFASFSTSVIATIISGSVRVVSESLLSIPDDSPDAFLLIIAGISFRNSSPRNTKGASSLQLSDFSLLSISLIKPFRKLPMFDDMRCVTVWSGSARSYG